MGESQGQKSCEGNQVPDRLQERTTVECDLFLKSSHDTHRSVNTVTGLGQRRRSSISETYAIKSGNGKHARRLNRRGSQIAGTADDLSVCHVQPEQGSQFGEQAAELYEIAKHVASSEPDSLVFDINHLRSLWSVSQTPPVTKASLKELDPARISSDAKLRHEINFEHSVILLPHYDGALGREKKEVAKMYWAVLAVEFALYMEHGSHRSDRSTLEKLADRSASGKPSLQPKLRLKHLLQALADILETLVLGEDLASVKEMIDENFLVKAMADGGFHVKQMAQDAHTFEKLADWLHVVLKKACSPQRDQSVDEFVTHVRDSIRNNDPCGLARAVEELFGILETMRLDVANNQIVTLRLHMLETSIRCEREYFEDLIREGQDFSATNQWFQAYAHNDIHPPCVESEQGLMTALGRAVVDLVADQVVFIPQTFSFDHQRILDLRHEWRYVLLETAVAVTYTTLLRRLGFARSPTSAMLYSLLRTIRQVYPGSNADWISDTGRRSFLKCIATEIVRVAYGVCRLIRHPTESDVEIADSCLCAILKPKAMERQDEGKSNTEPGLEAVLCSSMREMLKSLVATDMLRMSHMSSIEILSSYSPLTTNDSNQRTSMLTIPLRTGSNYQTMRPATSPAQPVMDHSAQDPACERRTHGLRALATRIAHLSTVHWRVWGNILYIHGPVHA